MDGKGTSRAGRARSRFRGVERGRASPGSAAARARRAAPDSVPSSTYRLQLGPDLDLYAAAELVGVLAELGVGHVYCSPILQSAPDAPHGYAVVDHRHVDVRLGGEEGRRRFVEALEEHGLGLVLDLVPNHMAIGLGHNRWFREVLEHGPSSRYAGHFDVDWDPPESVTRNKVLLPLLGDHYGRELESGTIRMAHEAGRFEVRYHDHLMPASPLSVAALLEDAAERSGSDALAFAARALSTLPPAAATDEVSRRRRHADAKVLGEIVRDLASRPSLGEAIDAAVDEANRDPDVLDRLLDLQNYRLARWRAASQELGYRRFFDVDTLIGLRMEDPEVFRDAHQLVLAWVAEGEVLGLRIDHPDGLRNPGRYLERLRASAPRAWIVVEKILEGDEDLPSEWPVDGTTGYEFVRDVTELLMDAEGESAATELWHEISGSSAPWEEVAAEAKRDVLHNVLAADLNRLAHVFMELCEHRRRYRDFTRAELTEALAETLVSFDVYRTYVPEEGAARPEDLSRIGEALERARASAEDLDPELFDLLGGVLSGELEGRRETELRMRFQQLTGPVMAKGVEDTAFYRYLRAAATCEVGGDPGRFGRADASHFHARCIRRRQERPTSMLALSTHDTKRSEDVRARLAVLSEIPDRWAAAVHRWRAGTAPHRPALLDGATEYLVYQTVVGAHPIGADRLVPYLEKATKEAKVHTSWTDPDPEYDAAVAGFARYVCEDPWLQGEIDALVGSILQAGRVNALAQKTLQLTAPGVPDIYQGTELWDLSLVDPDNRRPVDHALRARLLGELPPSGDPDPGSVLARMDEGLPKLWVVREVLALRRRRREAFDQGEHTPLAVTGPAGRHVVAFARGTDVAVVVPRLSLRLAEEGGWRDTRVALPDGSWRHLFGGACGGGAVPVGSLLRDFPVAVLERAES